MDPVQVLADARAAAATLLRLSDIEDDDLTEEIADEARGAMNQLAYAFEALDEWMSRGGFSPWTK